MSKDEYIHVEDTLKRKREIVPPQTLSGSVRIYTQKFGNQVYLVDEVMGCFIIQQLIKKGYKTWQEHEQMKINRKTKVTP